MTCFDRQEDDKKILTEDRARARAVISRDRIKRGGGGRGGRGVRDRPSALLAPTVTRDSLSLSVLTVLLAPALFSLFPAICSAHPRARLSSSSRRPFILYPILSSRFASFTAPPLLFLPSLANR